MTSRGTDVREFIRDLDGGVFEAKLSTTLSDVAASVIDHGAKGKVVITLDMERIGTSYQCVIKQTLKYVRPTAKGGIQETNTTETPMYVGRGGKLSLLQEDQGQLFTKSGSINMNGGQQ